ncbi:MAG: DinB family protein [Ignavibacteriaceae bacterium]
MPYFKKFLFPLISFFILVLTLGFVPASNPSDEPAFVKEFVGQMDYVEGQLTQLAEAMPEDSYGWSPGEGVRSVGQIYLHVAFGNYGFVTMSGGKVPEDIGYVPDPSKINEWDTQTTDKTEIIAIMKRSFDVLRETAKNFSQDDLDNKEIEFFGWKFSLRNFLVTGIAHCHEHLGQGIAYARMNGVTPPWSKKESEG